MEQSPATRKASCREGESSFQEVHLVRAGISNSPARSHTSLLPRAPILLTDMEVAGVDLALNSSGVPLGHTPPRHASGTPLMQRRHAAAPGIQE